MENEVTPFLTVRSILYSLVILYSIISMIFIGPDILYPSEGSYFYHNILFFFLFLLIISSIILPGIIRSLFIIISCTSLLSLELESLLTQIHTHSPLARLVNGEIFISIDVWLEILSLSLFLAVVIVEVFVLARQRAD